MNDELPKATAPATHRRPLEQRFAHRPDVLARLHQLADTLDESAGDDCTTDQAEERVCQQVRQLAQELLAQWAHEANAHTQAQVPTRHPAAVRHGKKKTDLADHLWLGGGGGGTMAAGPARRAPAALLRPRGNPPARSVAPPQQAVATLITQLDGTMIPIVVPATTGADRRRHKQLLWREARLCLVHPKDSATPCYGATLGSAAVSGGLWRATAQAAGLGGATHVHGVGDGAEWILTQFQEQFGAQGKYLVDFYHGSEYLAAAAAVIHPPNPRRWLHRQQDRLLKNKVPAVLRALAAHREAESAATTPVRTAHRYLEQRRAQLDYAGARAHGLNIGSGEIESGHRHVIHHRLKLAGSWWKEPNAEAMLGLRVARANNLWQRYWHPAPASLN